MAHQVKPRPRRGLRSLSSASPEPGRSQATITIEQSHARQISELPREQLAIVINAIREGAKNAAIAQYFGREGWLTVSEKSFNQYLTCFKRVYPDMIRGFNPDTLDEFVNPNQPGLDEETILEQLIRANGQRLAIGLRFEKSTGLLNQNLHKDIKTSLELTEGLAKLRGKGQGVGRPSAHGNVPVGVEAQEQLRRADTSSASQDRLANLTQGLAKLLEAKNATATTKS